MVRGVVFNGESKMIKYLQKDFNRHSSFNTAVTCFRLTGIFLFITLLAVLYYFAAPIPELKSDGMHDYTITDTRIHSTHHKGKTTHHYYLSCVDENGKKHEQTISKNNYQWLVKGKTYTCPSYFVENGAYYICFDMKTDSKEAAKIYYKMFPTQSMVVRKFAVPIPLIIAGIMFMLGLMELGREKKFIAETEIMREGLEAKIKDAEEDGEDFFDPFKY